MTGHEVVLVHHRATKNSEEHINILDRDKKNSQKNPE
jgi:hypothetical protein